MGEEAKGCLTIGCGNKTEVHYYHCSSHILYHDRVNYKAYSENFSPSKREKRETK